MYRLPARFLAAALVIVFASSAHAAQRGAVAGVDDFIASEMRRSRIPGLALAVVKDGRVILTRCYGLANVEHEVPVKPETVFQSGSIGKQFVAAAVLLLVEDGKLSLDDTVDKFFAPAPESWKTITIRHLLTHTSGMQDYPADYDLRRDYTQEELLAIVKASPLASSPGESWSYSNLGYVTLGILIGKVTGKFYGEFLRERVFGPLGMTTARVISEADIVLNRSAGYRVVNGEIKNQNWVSPSVNTTADGSLYLTLVDMVKWDAALSSGKLLSSSSLELVWTAARLSDGRATHYGFGWHTEVFRGRRVVHHGGAWQGFKSYIARFLDDHVTVIVFANCWDANEIRIARGVAAAFLPDIPPPPTVEPLTAVDPAVTSLAKQALRQLAEGAPDPSLFTSEAQAQLLPDGARRIRERLNAFSVPPAVIASIALVGQSQGNGVRVFQYALGDLLRGEIMTLRVAPDGRIAGLELRPE